MITSFRFKYGPFNAAPFTTAEKSLRGVKKWPCPFYFPQPGSRPLTLAPGPRGTAGKNSISPRLHSHGAGRFIILPLSAVRFTAESIRELHVKHEPRERHCVSPLISPLLGSGISEIQRIMEHRGIIFT